jgi:hypothetical protein
VLAQAVQRLLGTVDFEDLLGVVCGFTIDGDGSHQPRAAGEERLALCVGVRDHAIRAAKRSKLRIGRDDVHQDVQARHFVAGTEAPLAHNGSNLEAIEEWQLSYINPS